MKKINIAFIIIFLNLFINCNHNPDSLFKEFNNESLKIFSDREYVDSNIDEDILVNIKQDIISNTDYILYAVRYVNNNKTAYKPFIIADKKVIINMINGLSSNNSSVYYCGTAAEIFFVSKNKCILGGEINLSKDCNYFLFYYGKKIFTVKFTSEGLNTINKFHVELSKNLLQ